MRYDVKAQFQQVEEQYQSNGDYAETVVEEHIEYVAVTATDFETMHIIYGGIRQGSITIHLQNFVGYPFNRVVIDNVPYVVDDAIDLRVKKIYILSQWQN